jgi:hypothetical protein
MARVNRSWVRRVENAASEDAILIRQRDGSVKAFDKKEVMGELYLAQLDAALGRSREQPSDVMAALDNATPESREAVLRANTGPFMADLEPAEPPSDPPKDLSEP